MGLSLDSLFAPLGAWAIICAAIGYVLKDIYRIEIIEGKTQSGSILLFIKSGYLQSIMLNLVTGCVRLQASVLGKNVFSFDFIFRSVILTLVGITISLSIAVVTSPYDVVLGHFVLMFSILHTPSLYFLLLFVFGQMFIDYASIVETVLISRRIGLFTNGYMIFLGLLLDFVLSTLIFLILFPVVIVGSQIILSGGDVLFGAYGVYFGSPANDGVSSVVNVRYIPLSSDGYRLLSIWLNIFGEYPSIREAISLNVMVILAAYISELYGTARALYIQVEEVFSYYYFYNQVFALTPDGCVNFAFQMTREEIHFNWRDRNLLDALGKEELKRALGENCALAPVPMSTLASSTYITSVWIWAYCVSIFLFRVVFYFLNLVSIWLSAKPPPLLPMYFWCYIWSFGTALALWIVGSVLVYGTRLLFG